MLSQFIRRFAIPAALAAGMTAAVTARANSYQVVYTPGLTWAQASAAAQGLGAGWHLATIHNAVENAAVAALTPSGEFWLGGFQNPITEPLASVGWTWVDNSPITYFNWAPGEPNDYYGAGSEQYLAIGLGGNGLWNDEGNVGLTSGFVAENTPDSGSLGLISAAAIGALFVAKRRQA